MVNANTVFGLFEQLQSVDISVHQNRCVLVRNRNASCMKCAEACTSGCISYKNGELIVSPEKCIGCGTCATVCPTCALEAHHPSDQELYEAAINVLKNTDGEVTIACEQLLELAAGQYDPDKILGVKCLGRIEESVLILLARAKAQRVNLVQGPCDTCTRNTGLKTAELVCETANTLLDAWNQQKIVTISRKLPSNTCRKSNASYDVERRGFLTDMFDTAKSTSRITAQYALTSSSEAEDAKDETPTFQKVQDDGTLPHFLPHRRNRLLKGLVFFGPPEDIMIKTRLWGHVIIDIEACTSCQMCATFCPTEAIKKFEDYDGSFGIEHYPSRCVKCSCCASICPAGALTLSDEVFAIDLHSKSFERYEMKPRKKQLGPHQMKDSLKGLLNDEFVYER